MLQAFRDTFVTQEREIRLGPNFRPIQAGNGRPIFDAETQTWTTLGKSTDTFPALAHIILLAIVFAAWVVCITIYCMRGKIETTNQEKSIENDVVVQAKSLEDEL